jgi:hypothetical protein
MGHINTLQSWKHYAIKEACGCGVVGTRC